MERVSEADIQEVVLRYHLSRLTLNAPCKTCGLTMYYTFSADGQTVQFCTDCHGQCDFARLSSYGAVAVTFNREIPSVRKQMWDNFLAQAQVAS